LKSQVSIIVPGYNESDKVPFLIKALENQTVAPLEVIFVDDCSTDNTVELVKDHFTTLVLPENSGPAVARNVGMKAAKGEILAFLDADVQPGPRWVELVQHHLSLEGVNAVMNGVYIPKTTVLGNSIAALGLPGGGHLGLDKMWHVDEEGFTHHISGSNFAIHRRVYTACGGFDEGFEFNCEDAAYANQLKQHGFKLKYVPEMIVEHEAILKLSVFVRWHYRRGLGNYYLKQHLGKVKHLIRLRIWSTGNLFKAYWKDVKFPLILSLLALSFVMQQLGFFAAKWKDR